MWYVNKISGTNERRVNISSKFLQNVGLDKVVRSCKPNFHLTTILAAQLTEIHVWPVCNIVISCNTIFCCKVTNTKRIWRYLNKSLHRWPIQAQCLSAHLRNTIHYDNMLRIICSERYYSWTSFRRITVLWKWPTFRPVYNYSCCHNGLCFISGC